MCSASGSSASPPAPIRRSISADMAEKCKLGQCTRRSFNGQADQICCSECEQNDGTTHSPLCDALEESVQRAARWRKAIHASNSEKLTKFVCRCTNEGCDRYAYEAKELCCQACSETNGSMHSEDCEVRSSSNSAEGKSFVNKTKLGESLVEVDPTAWTNDRLSQLFHSMATETKGGPQLRFFELLSWMSCSGPAKDLSHVAIGTAPHNIGIKIVASQAGGNFAQRIGADVPQGFLLIASRDATVGEIAEVLCLYLGLPSKSVVLASSDGFELAQFEKLSQCANIVLPGPAARRRGDKLQLIFDVNPHNVTSVQEALIDHLDDEVWKAGHAERDIIAKQRVALAASMKTSKEKKEELRTMKDPDFELDELVRKKIAVSNDLFDELNNNQLMLKRWLEEGNVTPEFNYLVEVTDPEAKRIISDCLQRQVIRLYRNENESLKRRYEAAKERLRNCGRNISVETTRTQAKITGVPPLDHLGPYDPALNEYPMWHGTGRAAVSGICRTNFDIQRAGIHGLAYGTGFYFADDPSTSIGYSAGACDRVNDKYPRCAYMLLNRVMCGNIKHFERLPYTQQEFDMWTADCIGSGGVWAGKDAKYECIRSPGTFCWVAVHSHQIYPAYLIVYTP